MKENQNFHPFLKLAVICSILGAVTTCLLIFLPNPTATDFESQALLHQNKLYLGKLWILFIHPQVNFLAALGLAVILFRKYPLQIIAGTLFLFVWAFSEMLQQALAIDALNQFWRTGYLGAEDITTKSLYKTLITGATGISDSYYFVVIYGFGLGSLLYGLALSREEALGRAIGFSLVFIGLLSMASFLRYYLGLSFLNEPVNWLYQWVYPYLQPLVRIAIAVWIWQKINHYKQSIDWR